MKLYVGFFFFFFLPQFLKTRLQHVSRVAPVLNTAVCKTSLMLQRPNLFTGAYPICKKKKKWWGPRGEVRRVMLYSLWMDLKQSESITEKIYICANPPENVQERDTSKKKKPCKNRINLAKLFILYKQTTKSRLDDVQLYTG